MIKICKYKGEIGYYDPTNNILKLFTTFHGRIAYMRPKEQPIEITDCADCPTLKSVSFTCFNSQCPRYRRREEE